MPDPKKDTSKPKGDRSERFTGKMHAKFFIDGKEVPAEPDDGKKKTTEPKK